MLAAGATPSSDPDAYELMSVYEILTGKVRAIAQASRHRRSRQRRGAQGDEFPGLVPLVFCYLDLIKCDAETRVLVECYVSFILKRAKGACSSSCAHSRGLASLLHAMLRVHGASLPSCLRARGRPHPRRHLPACAGELLTEAAWMRQFVTSHPSYNRDSVVPPDVMYDLLRACHDIGEGRLHVPEMQGPFRVTPLAGRDTPVRPSHVRLRGASFAAEVTNASCSVVRHLLNKYMVRSTFADTPALLPALPPVAET